MKLGQGKIGQRVLLKPSWYKFELSEEGQRWHMYGENYIDEYHYDHTLLALNLSIGEYIEGEIITINWPNTELENYRTRFKIPFGDYVEINLEPRELILLA